MSEALKIDKDKVPLSRAKRIEELLELPNKSKEQFIPPVGFTFRHGPYVYRVAATNVGQLRFTAKLHDVVVEGIND